MFQLPKEVELFREQRWNWTIYLTRSLGNWLLIGPEIINIPSIPTIYPPPQLSFFGSGGCIPVPLWASFCSDLTSSFLSFPGSRTSIFIVHQQGRNGIMFASCPCDNVKNKKDSPVSGSGDKKRGREEEKERTWRECQQILKLLCSQRTGRVYLAQFNTQFPPRIQ